MEFFGYCFLLYSLNLFTSLLSGENKLIIDYTIKDWIEAFWARPYLEEHPNFRPIAFQFWFIRDLMVAMVFSPAIYILVKYLRSFIVFVFGILWILGFGFNVPGFSMVSFFSFSAGAYFSVYEKNFAASFGYVLPFSWIIYLIIALVDLCTKGNSCNQHIHVLGIIVGCIFVIGLVVKCIDNGLWKVNGILSSSTFFCMPITDYRWHYLQKLQ